MFNISNKLPLAPLSLTGNRLYLCSVGLLFLLAMHYYQPNGGGHGLSLSLNNTVWIAISLILSIGLWRIGQTKTIFYTRFDIVLLVCILGLAVPLLWSDNPWKQTTSQRYLAISGFGLFILTFRQFNFNSQDKKIIWLFVILGVLVQCIIGFIQFSDPSQWTTIINNRPSGSFQQVNVYASFLATGLALSVYMLFSNKYSNLLAVVCFLTIFFVSTLQWLVFSRVGLIGSFLVLLFFSIFYYSKSRKTLFLVWFFVISGILTGVAISSVKAVEGRSIDSVSKPGYRLVLYSVSWDLISQKPILGHGLGKFQTVFLDAQARAYEEGRINTTNNSSSFWHPHNEVLYWWVEGGLLPVIVILFIAFYALKQTLIDRSRRRKVLPVLAIAMPIILHMQTEYPLYHSAIHGVLLALILAMITSQEKKPLVIHSSALFRIKSILLFVCTFVFCVTNLHATKMLSNFAKTGDGNYLNKIINPFIHRIWIDHHKIHALAAENSPQSTEILENILLRRIQLSPTALRYSNLMSLYLSQGRKVQAKEIQDLGVYLFPESEYFKN